MIQSTRLRKISSSKLDDILGLVDSLPFKIEFKQLIQEQGGKYVLLFVIPDTVKKFENIDMDTEA